MKMKKVRKETKVVHPVVRKAVMTKMRDGARKLNDDCVLQYMVDIDDGAWTFCTAPITFYDNGNIADGQHRLKAIMDQHPLYNAYIQGDPRGCALHILWPGDDGYYTRGIAVY